MCQRNIRCWQIDYAQSFGKRYNRAGAEWLVIRRKDIPPQDRRECWAEKTVGLVVCIEHGVVSTAYYRDDPSHYIRCKPKGNYQVIYRYVM